MLQIEAKAADIDLHLAVAELRTKMADWTPALHGGREYVLGCAVAGTRLRFYAIKRGGTGCAAISREFNCTLALDRIEVKEWQ